MKTDKLVKTKDKIIQLHQILEHSHKKQIQALQAENAELKEKLKALTPKAGDKPEEAQC